MELSYPLELAKTILTRESLKKECAVQSQGVWEKRLAFADLKRKFPTLHDKVDEELLVDKERPTKRSDISYVSHTHVALTCLPGHVDVSQGSRSEQATNRN